MEESRLKKELDKSQLEPFTDGMDIDKKIEDFLTDEEKDQMRTRSKLYFETLWKLMENK